MMVPGGCRSQDFHGYFLGSLVAPFGFTRHLPHTHLQCMSIGLIISYKKGVYFGHEINMNGL